MPYRIHAKTGGSAFFVVVETPEDALAKFAELAETYRAGVTARDLSGRLIDLASLQGEVGRALTCQPFSARRTASRP